MIHSWNQAQWAQFTKNPDLHHGLLVTGSNGIGKREFCLSIVKYLLCMDSDARQNKVSCGGCQSCNLFEAGTHPDFHLLTSELENVEARVPLISSYGDRYQNVQARDKKAKPGKIISVDQVRQLIGRFSTQSHISLYKVVLIMPADALNVNASNALLKLLEEPPENSMLILMTSLPGFLPATIRSRCMAMHIDTPESALSLNWLEQFMSAEQASIALKLANGGPLDAKHSVDSGLLEVQTQFFTQVSNLLFSRISPLELAVSLSKSDLAMFLTWLHGFICELIRWKMNGLKPDWFETNDPGWSSLNVSVERLYVLYDKVNFYSRIVREPINIQLTLEDVILTLKGAVR